MAQHLVAVNSKALYYWRNVGREAEVDFLLLQPSGAVPVEVKAGTNFRSRSLTFYCEKYQPETAVRISLCNLKCDGRTLNVPLYAIQCLPHLLGS
mgnify:CR=1 FL=1